MHINTQLNYNFKLNQDFRKGLKNNSQLFSTRTVYLFIGYAHNFSICFLINTHNFFCLRLLWC